MAQWMGQFTGRTHETRVADVEAALRQAVESWHSLPTEEKSERAKQLIHLAERVISARLRCFKARLSAQRVPSAEAQSAHAERIACLERDVDDMRKATPDQVLTEFGLGSL